MFYWCFYNKLHFFCFCLPFDIFLLLLIFCFIFLASHFEHMLPMKCWINVFCNENLLSHLYWFCCISLQWFLKKYFNYIKSLEIFDDDVKKLDERETWECRKFYMNAIMERFWKLQQRLIKWTCSFMYMQVCVVDWIVLAFRGKSKFRPCMISDA